MIIGKYRRRKSAPPRLLIAAFIIILAACGNDGRSDDRVASDDPGEENGGQPVETIDSQAALEELRILPAWITTADGVSRTVLRSGAFSVNLDELEIRRDEDADQRGYTPTDALIPLPTPEGPSGSLNPWAFPALIEGKALVPTAPGELACIDLFSGESGRIILPGAGLNAVAYHPDLPGRLILSSGLGNAVAYSLDEMAFVADREYARPVRAAGFVRSDADELPMPVVISDSGWFALLDPESGEQTYRSLDVPGFRDAALSIDGTFVRAAASRLELLRLQSGESGPELVSTGNFPMPWRSISAVAVDGVLLVAASPVSGEQNDTSASVLYAFDPGQKLFSWVLSVPAEVVRIDVISPGRYLLAGRRENLLLSADADGDWTALALPSALPGLLFGGRGASTAQTAGTEAGTAAGTANGEVVPRLVGEDLSTSSEVIGNRAAVARRHSLPAVEQAREYSLLIDRPDADLLAELHVDGAYRYAFEQDDLPLEIPLSAAGQISGIFAVESDRQILITILDRQGSELLSSLDKVSLEPELRYELSRGDYRLRLVDAGGENEEERFVLSHESYP
jgi:hypothetical protein